MIPHINKNEERRRVWAAVLFLIAAAIAVYHNSFAGVFLFDGRENIIRNPMVDRLWSYAVQTERPLTYFTFALNHSFHGAQVWGYHVVNFIIHLLSAITLFGIVRRTLLSPCLVSQFHNKSLWFASSIALVWLVHPLHTESVTYIYQRAECLMGLFYLLTLYCAIRYMHSDGKKWFVLSVMTCFLGMASKAVMVTAPAIILIYDRVFFARSFKMIFAQRKRLYIGLFISWVFLAGVIRNYVGIYVNDIPVTPIQYALNQPRAILHYLRLAIWPNPLLLDYNWPFNDVTYNLPYIIVIVILLALTLRVFIFSPPLGFLGLWFFIILLPTSSIVPGEDIVFEHRMYLPLIAPVACFVLLIDRALDQKFASLQLRRNISVSLVAVLVTTFGFFTIQRNNYYHDRLKMWSDVLRQSPDNPRANYNLGVAYLELGDKEKTMEHFLKAVARRNDYFRAHNNLGNLFFEKGQISESVFHFEEALRLNPAYEGTYNNYGVVLMEMGNYFRAEKFLKKASQVDSKNPEVFKNLGNLYYMQEQFDKALEFYEQSLGLKPDYTEVQNMIANIYFQLDRYEDARVKYFEVLRLKPYDPVVHNNLGSIYFRLGDLENAYLYFEQALRFAPGYKNARHNLNIISSLIDETAEEQKEELGDKLIADFQGLSDRVFGVLE